MPGFGLIGGGGGGGDSDIVFNDVLNLLDGPLFTVALPESAYAVADALSSFGLDMHDQFEAGDNLGVGTVEGVIEDVVEVTDTSVFSCDMTPTRDFYLNRGAGGTSYTLSTTLLAKSNTPVVNDQKHAYIMWDLTGLDLPTPAFTSDTSLVISHDGIGDQPLFFETYEHTAEPVGGAPFPTWSSNEPPAGTLVDSGFFNVSATGESLFLGEDGGIDNPVLTAAGNQRWFYVRLLGNTNVGGDLVTFSIESVEAPVSKPVVRIGAVL